VGGRNGRQAGVLRPRHTGHSCRRRLRETRGEGGSPYRAHMTYAASHLRHACRSHAPRVPRELHCLYTHTCTHCCLGWRYTLTPRGSNHAYLLAARLRPAVTGARNHCVRVKCAYRLAYAAHAAPLMRLVTDAHTCAPLPLSARMRNASASAPAACRACLLHNASECGRKQEHQHKHAAAGAGGNIS